MRTDLFEFELPEDNTVQISFSQREGRLAGTGRALRGALILALLASPSVIEAQEKHSAEPRRIGFSKVDSWAYQLQNLKPSRIPKDAFDVLVVDYSRDGSDAGALDALDVITLRKRPDKLDRIVLSYLSIGEAEDYRFYWKASWLERQESKSAPATRRVPPSGDTPTPIVGKAGPSTPKIEKSAGVPDPTIPLAKLSAAAPSWLAEENPEWRGNYLVRYWEPGWQSIIFGSPAAYLDKLIAAGFDGIYLDKIESNDDWQKRNRPGAEREMVEFVKRLAAYARAKRPGFLIVAQNGDELLLHSDYLETIDAIAK
ncbi:MAG: endo alpha-1,4 polygalactosaminidase, partial [Hyphomicrobium sp.]